MIQTGTYLDKDDRLADSHQTIEFAQNVIFHVVIRTVNEHLRDALHSKLTALQLEAVRIGSELGGILHDVLREGSREKKHLDMVRQHAAKLISNMSIKY